MSEDLTQNLPSRSFEERVLAELSAIRQESASQFDSLRRELAARRETLSQLDARLTSLEEKVDARLQDTRPMWEVVQERLTGIEKELSSLNRHIRLFAGDVGIPHNRVDHLEDDVEELSRAVRERSAAKVVTVLARPRGRRRGYAECEFCVD